MLQSYWREASLIRMRRSAWRDHVIASVSQAISSRCRRAGDRRLVPRADSGALLAMTGLASFALGGVEDPSGRVRLKIPQAVRSVRFIPEARERETEVIARSPYGRRGNPLLLLCPPEDIASLHPPLTPLPSRTVNNCISCPKEKPVNPRRKGQRSPLPFWESETRLGGSGRGKQRSLRGARTGDAAIPCYCSAHPRTLLRSTLLLLLCHHAQ